MAYSVLDVDPDLYVEAGDRARRAARQVREAVDAAVGGHANSHNAAGKGDAGNAFADGHDQAARSLLKGAAKLATALDDVADRMALSAHTHAAAEWASSGRAGDPPGYPVPAGSQSTTFGSIPTMHGGTGATPQGWNLIQMVMAIEFPDADTDKVRHSAAVWSTLAEDLSRIQSSLIDDLLEPLSSMTAPDIAAIQAAVQPVIDFGRGLSHVPDEIATMCHKFAALAEEAGHFIAEVLIQLAEAIAAQELFAAILTVFSMGASEILSKAADLAEVLGASDRIVTFLRTFYETAALAVDGALDSVKGVLQVGKSLAKGGPLSKALFVSVRSVTGGVESAVVGGSVFAVQHGGVNEDNRGEFIEAIQTTFVAGLVGGGVADGGAGLWKAGREASTETEGVASDITSAEKSEPSPATEQIESSQTPRKVTTPDPGAELPVPATRKAATAEKRKMAAGEGVFAAAGAVGSIAATDLREGHAELNDPNTLLDPNVGGARDQLHEKIAEVLRAEKPE